MNISRNIHALVLMAFVLFICGCRSLSMKDIAPENNPNARLLPYLEPIVDVENVKDIYTQGKVSTTGKSFAFGDSYTYGNAYGNSLHSSGFSSAVVNSKSETSFSTDERVNDVINIFTKEVKQNIVDTSDMNNPRGYIVLRLNGRVEDTSKVLRVASAFTFGTLNLMGMPANYQSQELDIDVSIYNRSQTLVKQYTVTSQDTEFRAFYYGYTNEDANRKAAAEALKKALTEIGEQINRDHDEIVSKL